MQDQQAAFVEAMGQYLGTYGLSPMSGASGRGCSIRPDPRAECDRPRRVAQGEPRRDQRGGLRPDGLGDHPADTPARRSTREYFSIPTGVSISSFAAGDGYRRLLDITSQGLEAMSSAEPRSRARLEEVHDATAFIATAFPAALDEYLRDRTPPAAPVPSAFATPHPRY